jgi:hypothetical protein
MKTVIKIVITLAIISSIVGYCVIEHQKDVVREKAKEKAMEEARVAANKAEEERVNKPIHTPIRQMLDQMVERYGAVDDWIGKIGKKEKIFSINLEKLWVVDKPILFVGTVNDIYTVDKEYYQMKIVNPPKKKALSPLRSSLDGMDGRVSPHKDFMEKYRTAGVLQLDLKCKRAVLDAFLKENPNLLSKDNFVGVIAKIKQVKSVDHVMNSGEIKSVNVGIGNCLDIFFIQRIY